MVWLRRSACSVGSGLLVAWTLAFTLAAAAEPPDSVQRQAVQALLRHRAPQQRAEAMRRVSEFPPLDAARILVQSGLADAAPEVRRAAQQTLLKLTPQSDVARFLLKSLDRAPHNGSAAGLILVLAAAAPAEAQAEVALRIAGHNGKSAIATPTLIDVADGLGELATPAAGAALKRLTTVSRFAESFAVRRATLQALARVREPATIGTLVDLLPQLYGEARSDAVRYLSTLTTESHGNDAQAWQAWWKEKQAQYRLPDQPAAAVAKLAPAAGLSYYGLQVHARRMVFVIDVSQSMQGPRLQAAKFELTSVVTSLPENAEFGLLTFSDRVHVWQPRLTVALPPSKQLAGQYIAYLTASGMTAAYDALEAAFQFDAEAIYLLSDGQPTCGKIVDPAAICTAIARLNHYRRISLYTIGIAPGVDTPLDAFLKKLADDNFGLYRRVD